MTEQATQTDRKDSDEAVHHRTLSFLTTGMGMMAVYTGVWLYFDAPVWGPSWWPMWASPLLGGVGLIGIAILLFSAESSRPNRQLPPNEGRTDTDDTLQNRS